MSEVHDSGAQAPAGPGGPDGPVTGGEAPLPAVAAPRRSPAGVFFGVVLRPRSWLNLLYLALSFPLGLFYFVVLRPSWRSASASSSSGSASSSSR